MPLFRSWCIVTFSMVENQLNYLKLHSLTRDGKFERFDWIIQAFPVVGHMGLALLSGTMMECGMCSTYRSIMPRLIVPENEALMEFSSASWLAPSEQQCWWNCCIFVNAHPWAYNKLSDIYVTEVPSHQLLSPICRRRPLYHIVVSSSPK